MNETARELEKISADLFVGAQNLQKRIQAWLNRTDLKSRWPCPDCGRAGADAPLRMIKSRQEGGKETMHGCWLCNTEDLRTESKKPLMGRVLESLTALAAVAERLTVPVPEMWMGPEDRLCSFCGKGQKEVKVIVEGPGVFLCDECHGFCGEIIEERKARPPDHSLGSPHAGNYYSSYIPMKPPPLLDKLAFDRRQIVDEKLRVESRLKLVDEQIKKLTT